MFQNVKNAVNPPKGTSIDKKKKSILKKKMNNIATSCEGMDMTAKGGCKK